MRLVAALALVLLLSGCASTVTPTTVDGVTVLSHSRDSDDQREALLEGTLSIDKGCLVVVDTDGFPHGLILPAAAEVVETDGGIEVTLGGTGYRIHDAVSLGGGFTEQRRDDCDFADYFEPNGVQ